MAHHAPTSAASRGRRGPASERLSTKAPVSSAMPLRGRAAARRGGPRPRSQLRIPSESSSDMASEMGKSRRMCSRRTACAYCAAER
eukprot:16448707-Heterocapsa_arctica.AAC.1